MSKLAADVVQPPNSFNTKKHVVFLSGTMGDWRQKVIQALNPYDVLVLDPTNDQWDDTWQEAATDPKFNSQVGWELSGLEKSDMAIFMFEVEAEGAITLLEFGLFAPTKDCIACVEEGYPHKGNVDIVCKRYNIPLYHNLDDAIADLRTVLKALA